jgi:RNA polymerase sigma factor (sigma-70 family)
MEPKDRDRDLLERSLDGDAEALDELIGRHWSSMVDYTASLLNADNDDAQDIVQEVFLRLWEKRVKWQPVGTVRGFLFGVARNLARNRRRWLSVRGNAASSLRAFLQPVHRPSSPLELLEDAEQRALLEAMVARLPKRRKEVFLLVRLHGFSYGEVAEALDLSPQTVANHVSAALSDLRKMIDPG